VTEDDDSWRVGAQQDRPYEQLEAFERLFVTRSEPSMNDVYIKQRRNVRCVIRIELEDDEIGIVRKMMNTAEGKVLGVSVSNGAIGEL
jgi:hypothetical protein